MDERTLIQRFFADRVRPRPDVRLGIGDDGAVVVPEPGYDLVIATDSIFEGTHFPAGTPAQAVGHRSLAVNLSDLAAMGAEPLWCTLALVLPAADPDWLQDFSSGFFALADRFGMQLVGGDTIRGPLGATVTVHGRVPAGRYVARTGARPGDGVYVTGTPGDAVAGRRLLGDTTSGSPVNADYLRRRFLYPEPRLPQGRALVGVASAMIDLSDGLHDDLGKLAAASGVGMELDVASLPLSDSLRACASGNAIECALTGGDDYELCCTIPEERESALGALVSGWPCAFTRIGTVVAGRAVRWLCDERTFNVPDTTYRHF